SRDRQPLTDWAVQDFGRSNFSPFGSSRSTCAGQTRGDRRSTSGRRRDSGGVERSGPCLAARSTPPRRIRVPKYPCSVHVRAPRTNDVAPADVRRPRASPFDNLLARSAFSTDGASVVCFTPRSVPALFLFSEPLRKQNAG